MMKKTGVIFLVFSSMFFYAQEKETEIFTVVEEPAQYPGGISEMSTFIGSNIIFPQSARQDTLFKNCKSYIKFVIDEEGMVGNADIIKGCANCPACDEESLRVVKMMPRWIPARMSGRTVKCYYTLPVNFKIK